MIKKLMISIVSILGLVCHMGLAHADTPGMLDPDQVEVMYQYVEIDEYDFPYFNTTAMFEAVGLPTAF